jgi:hypothetical protein
MLHMKRALLFLLFWATAIDPASRGDEKPLASRSRFIAQIQMIVLPQKDALRLLPQLLDEKRMEGVFAILQRSIATGTAQLEANIIVPLLDGEPSMAKTVEEVRYSHDYKPPNVPDSVLERAGALKYWPHIGAVPTQFDDRKIGVSLEICASAVSAGKRIAIDCKAQHSRLLRMEKLDCGTLADGQRIILELPTFNIMEDSCTFTMRSGARVLLGTHKLSGPPDRIEFFILEVTAI